MFVWIIFSVWECVIVTYLESIIIMYCIFKKNITLYSIILYNEYTIILLLQMFSEDNWVCIFMWDIILGYTIYRSTRIMWRIIILWIFHLRSIKKIYRNPCVFQKRWMLQLHCASSVKCMDLKWYLPRKRIVTTIHKT